MHFMWEAKFGDDLLFGKCAVKPQQVKANVYQWHVQS